MKICAEYRYNNAFDANYAVCCRPRGRHNHSQQQPARTADCDRPSRSAQHEPAEQTVPGEAASGSTTASSSCTTGESTFAACRWWTWSGTRTASSLHVL